VNGLLSFHFLFDVQIISLVKQQTLIMPITSSQNLATKCFNRARYYDVEIMDASKAAPFYLLAEKYGNEDALHYLACMYEVFGNVDDAIKHHLMNVEKGHIESYFSLGSLYERQQNWEQAAKYYKLCACSRLHV